MHIEVLADRQTSRFRDSENNQSPLSSIRLRRSFGCILCSSRSKPGCIEFNKEHVRSFVSSPKNHSKTLKASVREMGRSPLSGLSATILDHFDRRLVKNLTAMDEPGKPSLGRHYPQEITAFLGALPNKLARRFCNKDGKDNRLSFSWRRNPRHRISLF